MLSRINDPISSKRAGQKAKRSGLVERHEMDILKALIEGKDDYDLNKMTAFEIGRLAGLNNVEVCRRMQAMVRDGIVAAGISLKYCLVKKEPLKCWGV